MLSFLDIGKVASIEVEKHFEGPPRPLTWEPPPHVSEGEKLSMMRIVYTHSN